MKKLHPNHTIYGQLFGHIVYLDNVDAKLRTYSAPSAGIYHQTLSTIQQRLS